MKKIGIILMILVLTLALCGCSREFTFPENSVVLGADVSGCTKEEGWLKVEDAAKNYSLQLTVDGISLPITGKDVNLLCSREVFFAAADALEAEETADFSGVVSFSEANLKKILDGQLRKDMAEAALVFDEAQNAYVLTEHAVGMAWEEEKLMAAAKEAIFSLEPQLTMEGITRVLEPAHRSDDPRYQEALETLNRMTGITLDYEFWKASANNSISAQRIPGDVLRSFVTLGEDGFSPAVDPEAVAAYCETLKETYNIPGKTESFVTTGGSTLNMTVDYYGMELDTESLALDIQRCMEEGISESKEAPYLTNGIMDMPYGGNYIEVNLTSQHLWYYKDGERLVSTDLVSGQVGAGMNTPTGIYSIYAKDSDTYLVGEDYRSYVNYWMPFYGGYGLHDATWRGSFGGDIYLYGGSHGCVNLPLSAAKTIYNNAPVGTKVILYGGVQYMPPLDQAFSGRTEYKVASDSEPFQLDIRAKHEDPNLSYKSDNTKVATVSEDGIVTVKGIGTANITVTAEKDMSYAEGSVTVRISVHSPCEEGRHDMGEPVVTEKPTCQPGLQRYSCTRCDYWEDSVLDPVQSHSFGQWSTVTDPTCTEEGLKERVCTCCQEETEVKPIPKLPHPFGDAPACPVCGKKNPDYIAPSEESASK